MLYLYYIPFDFDYLIKVEMFQQKSLYSTMNWFQSMFTLFVGTKAINERC